MKKLFPLFLSVTFLALAVSSCGPSLSPTATPILPTATPMPPTPTPLPATDTVCAAGCDSTTIQAAIDNAGTTNGAIIEITDPIHTEAGIVVNKDVTIRGLGSDDTIVQAHDWWPAWSPDGSQITFQSDRDGNYEIYVMNTDGTDQRRLTNNDAKDSEPAWRP